MAVLQIRQAQRASARVVIGLAGISGTGKTLSALMLAYGMTGGDGSKIGFIDAENKRGSLYAERETYALVAESLGIPIEQVTPFMIGDLVAPFSPDRYKQAINEFQKAGVEILIIDSVTHEWEGQGGCEDIAENGKRGKSKDWATAKREHKAFMNALLQSDMHIIPCIRAREKVEYIKDEKGQTSVRPIGVMPIQEKNFMFEVTASLMFWNEGKSQEVLKMPSSLRPILGRLEGYITAKDGADLMSWIASGEKIDADLERYKNRLLSVCEKGTAYITDAWGKTPEKIRDQLGSEFKNVLLSSAGEHDKQREMAAAKNHEAVAGINSEMEGDE